MTQAPLQYFTQDHAVSMTLRDYFAAKVMSNMDWKMNSYNNLQINAKTCYAIADAMMKAREA
jgi:hypothetical protein